MKVGCAIGQRRHIQCRISLRKRIKSSAVNCSSGLSSKWSLVNPSWVKSAFRTTSGYFKALGHASRLMMVKAYRHWWQMHVQWASWISGDLSTISKHLTVLKNAGIVEALWRRELCFLPSIVAMCIRFYSMQKRVTSQWRSKRRRLTTKPVNVVASDQAKRLSSQPITVKSTNKVLRKTKMSLPCITCLSISISVSSRPLYSCRRPMLCLVVL